MHFPLHASDVDSTLYSPGANTIAQRMAIKLLAVSKVCQQGPNRALRKGKGITSLVSAFKGMARNRKLLQTFLHSLDRGRIAGAATCTIHACACVRHA